MTKNLHPGGMDTTLRLLELAGLSRQENAGAALDLGAGSGQTLRLLKEYGYQVTGMDLNVRNPWTREVDFTKESSFKDETYDLIISECSLYVSHHQMAVLRKLHSVLNDSGILLVSDVFEQTKDTLLKEMDDFGYRMLFMEDITPLWKDYIIENIWNGTWKETVSDKPCFYYLFGAEKRNHS